MSDGTTQALEEKCLTGKIRCYKTSFLQIISGSTKAEAINEKHTADKK